MKLKIDNHLVDITTIHNGILDGELKIYNKDNIVFSCDIAINHADIDMLSLELYKEMMFVTPTKTGFLDVIQVLEMMQYITSNFLYANETYNVSEIGVEENPVFVYDNLLLTTITHKEETEQGTRYDMSNSEFKNVYLELDNPNTATSNVINLLASDVNYVLM